MHESYLFKVKLSVKTIDKTEALSQIYRKLPKVLGGCSVGNVTRTADYPHGNSVTENVTEYARWLYIAKYP